MSLWRHLTDGIRVLAHRTEADRDLQAEAQHFLDEAAAELEQAGMSPAEARRAARLSLGSVTAIRDDVRASGWEHLVSTTTADVRYGLRGLRRSPSFAAVCVLTLAIGIGATTAIASTVRRVLFDPLPYPDAGRVVAVWYGGADGGRASQAFGTYVEIAARARLFDALTAYKAWQPALSGAGEPERLDGQRVTAGYFRVLGVAPRLGGGFGLADDRPGGADVAVVSDGLWRRRFSGDPAVVGRRVMLDDRPFTIVGVMPAGFENVVEPSAEIWSLLQYDATLPASGAEWGHHLHMLGRIRAGSNVEDARREIGVIARAPVPQFVRRNGSSMDHGLIVVPLQEEITRAVRPALLALGGGVLLVLCIACVNVTNLLLARAGRRRQEFATRVALGAARPRLARQLITEGLLLAFIGGGLGLWIAEVGLGALVAVAPANLPRAGAVALDRGAFALAFVVTAAVGLLVGLVPALRFSRVSAAGELREASRSVTGHQRARRTLTIVEVAVAVVLLVNTGLLVRSLSRLLAQPLGFDSSHVLSLQVQVASAERYRGDAAYHAFFEHALDAVRQVAGVADAAWTNQLPLSGDDPALELYGAQIQRPDGPPLAVTTSRYVVTPSYFETMRIPLRRGRLFTDHEEGHPRPVVISESFARRVFQNADPIGRRLRVGGPPNRPLDEIVGVVGDVRQASLDTDRGPAIYADAMHWLWADNPLWLVVRAHGDATALAPAIRQAVWSVDKDQPVMRVATLDARVATSEATRAFVSGLFATFATVALLLAAIGIFGIVSGSVTERWREIGVRAALGATRSDILSLVVGQALALIVVGLAIGFAAAVPLTRVLSSLLFGVSSVDPITHLAVVAVLACASVLACWAPARRAASVDPAVTLRAE